MKYYIAENGQPAGPFEASELLAHGLTVNSLVWGEGMPNWTSASQVPELMALLSGGFAGVPSNGGVDVQLPQTPPMGDTPIPQMPSPPVNNPQPTPNTPYDPGNSTLPNNPTPFPQGGSANAPQSPQVAPKTWLLESVLATVACSFCCGVPLIGLIPGIIAIFNAWSSKTCYAKGDNAGGAKKAKSAKMWFFITLLVGAVCGIYGGINNFMNNPNLIQDIQNGNVSPFYGI